MCGINNCKNSFFNDDDDCCTDTCEVGTGKDKDGDTQMQNNLNHNLLRGIMECKNFILYTMTIIAALTLARWGQMQNNQNHNLLRGIMECKDFIFYTMTIIAALTLVRWG